MPIYEYQCGGCGKVHEILQKMSDSPLAQCPECSGKLEKRISQCSFHLKGSGWYVTDYANSSGKASSSPTESDNNQSNTAKADESGSGNTACNSACKSDAS